MRGYVFRLEWFRTNLFVFHTLFSFLNFIPIFQSVTIGHTFLHVYVPFFSGFAIFRIHHGVCRLLDVRRSHSRCRPFSEIFYYRYHIYMFCIRLTWHFKLSGSQIRKPVSLNALTLSSIVSNQSCGRTSWTLPQGPLASTHTSLLFLIAQYQVVFRTNEVTRLDFLSVEYGCLSQLFHLFSDSGSSHVVNLWALLSPLRIRQVYLFWFCNSRRPARWFTNNMAEHLHLRHLGWLSSRFVAVVDLSESPSFTLNISFLFFLVFFSSSYLFFPCFLTYSPSLLLIHNGVVLFLGPRD